MPFLAVLHFLIAIGFVIHASRTGRPQVWVAVLLMVPLLGSVAYVLYELLPELAQTRRARGVISDFRTLADPDREYRTRKATAETVGSVDARVALASECERKEMWAEAIDLYQLAETGFFANDPALLTSLARAELGAGRAAAAQATLDRLRTAHPEYHSTEAHLIYARAYEAQGRLAEAAAEYDELIREYLGFEARTRYALLLQRMGEVERARALFQDVVHAGSVKRWATIPGDNQWLRVAQQNLDG